MQSRRRVRTCGQVFATLAIAFTFFGLQPAGGAFASSSHAAQGSTNAGYQWKGHDPSCAVRLPLYGSIKYKSFTTCPPKRVLLLGDSVALTMGIQLSLDEENWGTLIDNASLNDCGFATAYSVEYLGTVTPTNPKCATELIAWVKDIHRFKPQAVIVEMGWWDSLQHLINGNVASLAQPQYDTLVEQQILALVASLRSASGAPIYLLSVPWMNPGPLSNGQPEPAASAASHDEINALLKSAAQKSKSVHFVDISSYITPSGKFETKVGGGKCRASDGIELYYTSPGPLHYVQTQCGKDLQKGVLSMIRQALAGSPHHHS
jgi:hypothetical protein